MEGEEQKKAGTSVLCINVNAKWKVETGEAWEQG